MNISKLLQIVILSTITLGLQSSGHAQTNLVNLYDWTAETYPLGGEISTSVYSSNSAGFAFSYSLYYQFGPDILTGNLDTTPGANYEISFTMHNQGDGTYLGDPIMSFGNFSMNCSLLVGETYGPNGYVFIPENYDFTVVATDPITTMTFTVVCDHTQAISLSNVSVMEVPEMSVPRLFGFGMCALLLAQQWRRIFQKRKRN